MSQLARWFLFSALAFGGLVTSPVVASDGVVCSRVGCRHVDVREGCRIRHVWATSFIVCGARAKLMN
jgi:hypothetical protein